jgi:hypothetical protein
MLIRLVNNRSITEIHEYLDPKYKDVKSQTTLLILNLYAGCISRVAAGGGKDLRHAAWGFGHPGNWHRQHL